MNETLGRYRCVRRLGEGGMGVVYEAEDTQLGRRVALKMLREGHDARLRERLVREARTAASVSHPGVCKVYDVGEAEGEVYIAMELLEGEPLAARVARGALPIREAISTILDILQPLDALHQLGLVHRDLKPSNVFLTPHGVKLLDFGLARLFDSADEGPNATAGSITATGALVGTPQYMAPEQLTGGPCDARTDLWAVGVIFFELLTGRPPFAGTLAELLHAVLFEQVPPLGGAPSVATVDRVIQCALSRRASDRYPSVQAMRRDLRAALDVVDSGETAHASRLTRLIALPLRLLRPDPEIEFLAFSLADAISTSLSGVGSLSVRSTLTATRIVTEPLDLKVVAEQAEVDVVVTGTLLRAGSQVRVGVQLLEAPTGTLLWSETRQIPLEQLFDLQDELARGIAESLALPLTVREQRLLRQDVPATPRAYEHYLRANRLCYESGTWTQARALYERCVDEDPNFAPAWARLGRMHRVHAKFDPGQGAAIAFLKAEAALKRALELNPDLALAHVYYASLELDTGRAEEALTRLITRALMGRGNADLFAGLVQACRYCGLLEASAAAHTQARRLDPRIPTSVLHTWWMLGDYGRVLDETERGTDPVKGMMLAEMGRTTEAIAALLREEGRFGSHPMGLYARMLRLVVERDFSGAIALATEVQPLARHDPESAYYIGRMLVVAGDVDIGIDTVRRAVDGGFFCTRMIRRDPWLDSIRGHPDYARLIEVAGAHERRAAQVFRDAGGEALLGVTISGILDAAGEPDTLLGSRS